MGGAWSVCWCSLARQSREFRQEGSPQSLTALETVDAVLVNTDQTLSQATNAVLNQQFAEVTNYASHGHVAVYVRK